MCNAKTLIEQQEIWPRIRRVLLSRALHWAVVSTEWFAWKAAGVPPAQRRMIVEDHRDQVDGDLRGEAIWEYIVNTLDPVVKNTLVGDDNYFYLLCLQGRYSQRQVHGCKYPCWISLTTLLDATRSICPTERTANSRSPAHSTDYASTPTNYKKSSVESLQAPSATPS